MIDRTPNVNKVLEILIFKSRHFIILEAFYLRMLFSIIKFSI